MFYMGVVLRTKECTWHISWDWTEFNSTLQMKWRWPVICCRIWDNKCTQNVNQRPKSEYPLWNLYSCHKKCSSSIYSPILRTVQRTTHPCKHQKQTTNAKTAASKCHVTKIRKQETTTQKEERHDKGSNC